MPAELMDLIIPIFIPKFQHFISKFALSMGNKYKISTKPAFPPIFTLFLSGRNELQYFKHKTIQTEWTWRIQSKYSNTSACNGIIKTAEVAL